MHRLCLLLLTVCPCSLYAQPSTAVEPPGSSEQKGIITVLKHAEGGYARYLPYSEPEGILVIVHGSADAGETDNSMDLAKNFLSRWTTFAERFRLIALAPAFENENFGSAHGPGGGYRGLFGRYVDADVFVNHLVDEHKARIRNWEGRIVLYGHSAGGQFANRYCVRHPDQILAAAISAAGGYAMPDPNVEWPDGMRQLKRSMQWGPSDVRRRITVRPDPAGWLEAATLPIAVVVGGADTQPDPQGSSHVDLAKKWVQDMRALAQQNKRASRMSLSIIGGVGHNSKHLTPACQEVLARGITMQRALRIAATASQRSQRHDLMGATASAPARPD